MKTEGRNPAEPDAHLVLFGSKSQFAIEAMVEPTLVAPSSVWGRMRVWCAGTPLGNLVSEHCGLPCSHFEGLGQEVSSLWRQEFADLNDDQLFDFVDFRLYGYVGGVEVEDERSNAQCGNDARCYGKFDFLNGWQVMFDHIGKSFIFCPNGIGARILHRPVATEPCVVFEMPATAITDACQQFADWHEGVALRLGRTRSDRIA